MQCDDGQKLIPMDEGWGRKNAGIKYRRMRQNRATCDLARVFASDAREICERFYCDWCVCSSFSEQSGGSDRNKGSLLIVEYKDKLTGQ